MSDLSVPSDSTPPAKPQRRSFYRYLATSDAPIPRAVRRTHRWFGTLSVPAPAVVVQPLVWIFLHVRRAYYWFLRIFICEPFFKAHCKRYGRNVRTDCYLHWIEGAGDIVLGDDVWVDGKCSITFGARYAERPLLQFGDRCGIGHECAFIIGRAITIGADTVISGGTVIQDSNGHRTDPRARLLRLPPAEEEVRPVVIGAGVWIGRQCQILPGVRIGDGSVVGAGSVVRTHVPPYSVVAGNPAKVMFRLKKPDAATEVK
jgi:acetyltransferase-like isoleucine patch superfamily enzyme